MKNVSGIESLTEKEIDRIIEMAWEDRTPFEAIKYQFGVSEAETIRLMRKTISRSSFNLWRKRVNSNISQKHLAKGAHQGSRFKCTHQKSISLNKIAKRSK
ncbi:TIGR03643 family protein [Cytophagaceae bacterium YF14B1]|uniref:TIGR03643 family protein n=1 Tax=Xanthocytophaga flava TaxID=3048013 RepID=A0AAE3U9A1_9BACT|nr:TIGR03643 family protein [Xanthocytophaga flavus]MDJ1484859.1 TIGR03643 family protein [Xanthocytophaga flavus]